LDPWALALYLRVLGRLPLKGPKHRFVRHPLYGQVRVIRVSGGSREHWIFDPTFEPELPPGAVRGDLGEQVSTHYAPQYFYVDQLKQCVQCKESCVFSATEQKYWYESLKFRFSSKAIRCVKCRQRRRSVSALGKQIAEARAALRQRPDDPADNLALARALVEYHERTGHGRLSDAVAAARRAAKGGDERVDASLWEGLAHARAGRADSAQACLRRFLRSVAGTKMSGVRKAEDYLMKIRSGTV
jgi:hypothetical protein